MINLRPDREHGLDALRVFAFAVLILYHSGMPFVGWRFHIENADYSPALRQFMVFANRWRLPLLFFIAGAAVSFSLGSRGYGRFAAERIKRLFLPLAVGMLLVVPPQVYLERLHRGATFTFAEFYPTVFQFIPYPQGNTSWHHLWFVAYILVYSLLSIPLFAALRSGAGKRAVGALASAFERWPWAIYLVNIPNLAVGMTLGPRWPTTHNLTSDWANLTGCWLTFLWGFVFASDRRMLDVLTRRRREFLILGTLLTAAFYALGALGWYGLYRDIATAYLAMAWIFTLIGYARVWVTKSTPALRYATEVVYPFYIVHQTVTIALVYYVVHWKTGVWPKFAVTAIGTLLGSWVLVEVVRRIVPLRPLFGLKLRRSIAAGQSRASASEIAAWSA